MSANHVKAFCAQRRKAMNVGLMPKSGKIVACKTEKRRKILNTPMTRRILLIIFGTVEQYSKSHDGMSSEN